MLQIDFRPRQVRVELEVAHTNFKHLSTILKLSLCMDIICRINLWVVRFIAKNNNVKPDHFVLKYRGVHINT